MFFVLIGGDGGILRSIVKNRKYENVVGKVEIACFEKILFSTSKRVCIRKRTKLKLFE